MRLLLAIPPLLYAERWTQVQTSHLLNLYSWVRRRVPACDVAVLDLDREVGSLGDPRDLERLRAAFDHALARHEPTVVGLSCWTSLHYAGTVELARRVKRWRPGVPVIVGGYHATGMPDDFAGPERLFDYVVRGEGELALQAILEDGPTLAGADRPRVIDGQPVVIEEEELLFDSYPYTEPGKFELYLSRGCPFPCQFCVEPAMTTLRGATWRSYSWAKTERLLTDLIERRGARYLVFGDALFGAKASFRHAIWELLARYPDPPAVWCETRVDLLDATDYDYLARLPVHLDVGLDAITLESVGRMQKARNPEAYLESFRRYLEAMAARRQYVRAYLIVNYPGETLETLGQTVGTIERIVLDLAKRHGQSNLFVGAQCYQLFPGTPDYARRAALEATYGARFPNDGWWREALPRPEVRAAAGLPSRRLLEQGGLGAARSAIEYIRTVCRKHGIPAVHHEYKEHGVPPRRFRGAGFGSLLEGNPQRFHGLALVLADHARLEVDAEASRAWLWNALLDYSTRIDVDAAGVVRALVAAPTLGAGLATLEPAEADAAFAMVMGLCDQGFLDLRLAPADARAPRADVCLDTTEGTVRATPVDAEAAALLEGLIRAGYLDGLRLTEAWPGLFACAPIPPSTLPSPSSAGADLDLGARPGLFACDRDGERWPLLAIAREPAWLAGSARRWRRLADATLPVPATLTVRSRLIAAR